MELCSRIWTNTLEFLRLNAPPEGPTHLLYNQEQWPMATKEQCPQNMEPPECQCHDSPNTTKRVGRWPCS